MSVLIAFEPDCIKYEPYSQAIDFSHDRLVFASGDNTYVEWPICDLKRMQFTLELLDQVLTLAGPTRASLFAPFIKRLRSCLRCNFFPKIQIAALGCLAHLAIGDWSENLFERLVLVITRCFDANGQLWPIAQHSFLAILRDLLRMGIESGRFTSEAVSRFLCSVPDIIRVIWAPRNDIPVDEQPSPGIVEEELALLVMHLYDSFPEQMNIIPIHELIHTNDSPYFMLVYAKYVSLTHVMDPAWENALLLAVSNALGDDDMDIVRVGCAALMLIVRSIALDPEFINEILSCAKMALRKQERVKRTADAVVVLLSALMQMFPEAAAKPENILLWLGGLPVTANVLGREVAYQYLITVMQSPELLEMRGEVVVKIAETIETVIGKDIIDQQTEVTLGACLAVIVQNPEIGAFLQMQDETVQRRFAILIGEG
jgi:hypothetical protein